MLVSCHFGDDIWEQMMLLKRNLLLWRSDWGTARQYELVEGLFIP
jgi:hypothetical protein